MILQLFFAACTAALTFIGTICTPGGTGKHPAIILLGGSEGGEQMSKVAPRFAQQGYVAVSVAYFGMPGLPQTLESIPLESVGKAVIDVAARPDVDANRIAIMGYSKGGELSLAIASHYPQIHAVIAGVPSPFAWQGIAQGPSSPQSSWTFGGKQLPFVAYGTVMGNVFMDAYSSHAPLDLRKGYDASMQTNAAQIPAAMFPLENIRGPVLFIGADDDHIWNSDAQSQLGLTYLQQHHHPYADEYEHYPGGHLFLFATSDHPMVTAPMGPMTLLLGGDAKTNAASGAAAWPKVDAFLKAALH